MEHKIRSEIHVQGERDNFLFSLLVGTNLSVNRVVYITRKKKEKETAFSNSSLLLLPALEAPV